jgi:esterase/lipase superfamily enzyme
MFCLRAAVIIVSAGLLPALGSCAGRPHGNLVVVNETAPNASRVDLFVVTTRASLNAAKGEMFTGERGATPAFANIEVPVPADSERKIGEIQWPKNPPGDPAQGQ